MITNIKIDGFKSFRNFEMEFSPFTVIAGLNASGKSNLFDALELLSRLAEYSLKDAFPERRGTVSELFTLMDGENHMSYIAIEVDLLLGRFVKDNWGQEAEIKTPRVKYKIEIERKTDKHGFEELFVRWESLKKIPTSEDTWSKKHLSKKDSIWKSSQSGGSSKPYIETFSKEGIPTISIRQDGRQGGKATPANSINQTVLAGINSVDFPHVYATKEEIKSWKFMQLNPEELRKPTIQDPKMSYHITYNGANLASALFRIKTTDPEVLIDISRELNKFLPEFIEVDSINDEANRQFVINLISKDKKQFSSRVLSEGTLRLLALLILKYDDQHAGLLCFEEPENGIHPMRIKEMAKLLISLAIDFQEDETDLRQVIVNTHSPLLVREMLNYKGQRNISVWLSRMSTTISTDSGKRAQYRTTSINKVSLSEQKGLLIEKWNVSDLADYLDTLNENVSV